MFADTGMKVLLEKMDAIGAEKKRMQVRLAGGTVAEMDAENSDIGKRLSAIEKALEIGTLNEKEIKNINKLTQEVNVIQGYISNDVEKILELRDLQTKVLKVDNLENKINDLIVVKNDLSNFKTTTYLLAGLLFTMLFGSWIFSNRQKQSHTPVTKAGGVK